MQCRRQLIPGAHGFRWNVRARSHSLKSGQRPDGAAGSPTVLGSGIGRKDQSVEPSRSADCSTSISTPQEVRERRDVAGAPCTAATKTLLDTQRPLT
jgi:hypothetical protein